jgi:hypothetical protein
MCGTLPVSFCSDSWLQPLALALLRLLLLQVQLGVHME